MFKKILALIFSLLIIAAPIYKVSAVEDNPYTYTVTVYAGNQGSLPSGSYTESDIAYGNAVTLDWNSMSLTLKNPDKYYVRGFKLAGHDNDELLAAGSFTVTEDTDLVISYGVRDDGMVNYSVKFLEEGTNKELASATQYEGRVGDKPIVSHKFIEGYLPNALNVTKTLTSNEADNVFTFYYHAVEYTNTVYETLYGPSGTGGGGGGGGATPSGGETTPEGGETPTPTPAPSGGGEEMPPEIIDDDNPPLAPGGDDNTPGGNGGGNSRILAYVAGAVGVAAVATGIILFARKKRDDDEDDEE